MCEKDINKLIDELLPVFRDIAVGEYAIALGGSYAKGKSDSNSDIDIYIYIYCENAVGYSKRKELILGCADNNKAVYMERESTYEYVGLCNDFDYKGRRIETVIRFIGKMDEVISDCSNGVIKCKPEAWTTFGYYNHCNLADVASAKGLDDEFGVLSSWQDTLRKYPVKLKRAIISRHFGWAKLWPDNFHYTSAIKRNDIVFVSSLVQQMVHNLIQVLFAINEIYFPGDKHQLRYVENLAIKPEGFVDGVRFLLSAPGSSSEGETSRFGEDQRQVIKKMIGEIDSILADERG